MKHLKIKGVNPLFCQSACDIYLEPVPGKKNEIFASSNTCYDTSRKISHCSEGFHKDSDKLVWNGINPLIYGHIRLHYVFLKMFMFPSH